MGEYLNLQSSLSHSRLLEDADRLRSQIRLTSLGAGSSSMTCACEFISGLWVAPYQGFCVLALTLKERASELIRN